MVNEGRGRLFRRKDDKYLIYVPKDLCEDSMFPFKMLQRTEEDEDETNSIKVKVSFRLGGEKKLIIEEWKE